MNKIVFSLAAVLLVATATAGPVDSVRARSAAQSAVRVLVLETHPDTYDTPLSLTDITATMGIENIFAFNYSAPATMEGEGTSGFVILSGDDIAAPVLAFSDEGPLCSEDLNPAVRFQLETYSRQIASARAKNIKATPEVERKWVSLLSGEAVKNAYMAYEGKGDFYNDLIPKLLGNMKWGQSRPYNNKCPRKAITGCVATAFGMIMNYWDYPEHGFGQNSYDGNDNPAAYPNWKYGRLTVDFESTYYDWQNMTDIIDEVYSSTSEKEAVGTLLYHIGVSLNMRYGEDGSGCWSLPEYATFDTSLHLSPLISAPYRIRKHFGYKYSYAGMRDSIGDDILWMQMLYNSLAEGKPIYYAGWAADSSEAGHSATSGHGYLIDGYFSDQVDSNLFHINWGWNGNADGYFKLDAMTPQNYDFTQWHGAVIGLEPDTSYHGYNPAAIPATPNTTAKVYARNGSIVAENAGDQAVVVYDLVGHLVATMPSHMGDHRSISVRPGFYMVRVGMSPCQKVIVNNF